MARAAIGHAWGERGDRVAEALVTTSITDAIYRSAAAEAEVPVEKLTREVPG